MEVWRKGAGASALRGAGLAPFLHLRIYVSGARVRGRQMITPRLDKRGELALKKRMRAKGSTQDRSAVEQRKLARELAQVVVRREKLWNELAAHSAAMNERAARGVPVQRLLAQHQRMRERYCVVENRRQELLAVVPTQPLTVDF